MGRIGPVGKLGVSVVWLLLASVPSAVLLVLDVRLASSSGADASGVILGLLWLTCAALLSPLYARVMGRVEDVQPLLQAESELHHLPRGCARLVREAAAIRANIEEHDQALLRAWQLAQEVEHATPDVRAAIDHCGATLDPVHQLIDNRRRSGRTQLSGAQLSERLATVLSTFEDALRYPRATTFR